MHLNDRLVLILDKNYCKSGERYKLDELASKHTVYTFERLDRLRVPRD
jgi:hypothetical protein